MKKLILAVSVMLKNEVTYKKITVVDETMTVSLLFKVKDVIYNDFKKELLSSGFRITHGKNSSILKIRS